MVHVPDASKKKGLYSIYGLLLIQKAQLQKMEELILRPILRKLKIQACCVSRKGRMNEVRGQGDCREPSTNNGPRRSSEFLNLFVPG